MKPQLPGSGYRPPTAKAWRKIVAVLRNMFPLDFPVSVSRARRRPAWIDKGWAAGSCVEHKRNGKVRVAYVWIDPRQQRNSAVDALQHEWAHLMCEEARPDKKAAFLHDDRFWVTMGKVYRAWQRET